MPKYYVKGSGAAVELTDKDFVARGGEKSVFAKGGTAYCVYHDPAAAIPPGKIAELTVLDRPEVVRPVAELLDGRKRHCGETMAFVTDSFAPSDPNIRPLVLCQLFTNAFRRKHAVTNEHVVKISDSLLSVATYCNAKGIVLVDPNETNWLVHQNMGSVFLIDTSCCQTPSFPGTAIKLAVRDWSSPTFTSESDRFSVAVVLAWLWAGIHPYLAFHPDWKHMDANTAMEPRMRKHASFFDPKTEFNRACRPLGDIPDGLRSWLRAVLHEAKRPPFPLSVGDSVVIATIVQQPAAASTGDVTVEMIAKYTGDIVGVFGEWVAVVGGKANEQHEIPPTWLVGYTPLRTTPIAFSADNRMLKLVNLKTGDPVSVTCCASSVFESDGRIYAVGSGSVSEVAFNELATSTRATLRHVGSVAELPTTRIFPGCVIQNLLGKYLVSVFPESGKCQQFQLPELVGWQILGAKYQRGILVVMAESGGAYAQWVYVLEHPVVMGHMISDQLGDVNFCVTEAGVCVLMEPDGTLRAFRKSPSVCKRAACPVPDALLFARGPTVLAADGRMLYKLSMK